MSLHETLVTLKERYPKSSKHFYRNKMDFKDNYFLICLLFSNFSHKILLKEKTVHSLLQALSV